MAAIGRHQLMYLILGRKAVSIVVITAQTCSVNLVYYRIGKSLIRDTRPAGIEVWSKKLVILDVTRAL